MYYRYCLAFVLDGALSLLMIDVHVPKYVEKNGNATLECNFDLEGDILYSVKWFKDQHEFYQYTPSETHSIKVFINRSFKVDVSVFCFV